MPASPIGPELQRMIDLLAKLPGLGPRSAKRAALHLLNKREPLMRPLAFAIAEAAEKVEACRICGNLDSINPCAVCADATRDPTVICVVESVGDLWAMERAGAHRGRYHVLGGLLSPLDGVGPDDLNIGGLVARANEAAVGEVILALAATVDGQTTAHYVADSLSDAGVKVSQLSQGVPVGGELDYLDEGTIAAAMKARRPT
ncbi:MAG: recombination mediator RecR [Pseudomonadota bacterium]